MILFVKLHSFKGLFIHFISFMIHLLLGSDYVGQPPSIPYE